MIATLSTGILVLFAVAALVAFAVPFYREAAYKQLTWVPEWSAVKSFAAVLFPFLVLLGAAQFFKIGAGDSLRYLALGAVVPFILTRLNIPARLTGVLLLALTVLLTWFFKEASVAPVCFALISGMTVWKLAENLLLKSESTLEDILPPLIWLVGLNWIRTILPQAQYESREGLLLGTLSVVLLLRVLQSPFLTDDKLYLKKIILAATGGLGLLIVITKLLVLPLQNSICPIAALVGAGIFVAYLFDAMQNQDTQTYGPMEAITVLVLVGILTLIASRVFGNFGLLVLAPAMLVGGRASFAHQAALFLVARGLLQGYINTYVQNVTGINIMHAYSAAALFAGFLLAAVASMSVRDVADRRWLTTIFLSGSALTPLLSNYFLHEEPTGSLLVSCLVAATMFAALAPALYRQVIPGHENVLLLPTQMTAFALLGSELVSLGNEGTAGDKIKILIYCALIVLFVSGLLYWLFSRKRQAPQAPAVEGS